MPKGKILRALLGMKHSPAGKKYLKGKKTKKDTQSTYFKGKAFERPSIESQLRAAGLTKSDLRSLGGKKKK